MTCLKLACLKLACALVLASAAAHADAPTPPPSPKEREAIVQAYGEADANCLEWTDGCVICRRLEGAEAACSTPGVACEPGDIACRISLDSGASSTEAR